MPFQISMGRRKKQVSSKLSTPNGSEPISDIPKPTTISSKDTTTTTTTTITTKSTREEAVNENHWSQSDVNSEGVVEVPDSTEAGDVLHEKNANQHDEDTPKNDDIEIDEKLDILGNGLLTKKVLEKGLGRETRPNHGDVVTISYQCWLEKDQTLVEDIPQLTFTLGDGDVIHAFDLAIPLAELKEKFELVVDARFAFGSRGRDPDIPGNATLRYHIQLLACDDPPQYTSMSGDERLTIAEQKREKGNYYFRREEYNSAMNSYLKALKILSPDSVDHEVGPTGATASATDLSADCFKEMNKLILILHNNLAATQLKLQAYDAAIKSCDIVLRKEPQNFKAMFRKGRALVCLGNADEAIPVLKKVLELVPHSSVVASELQVARKIQQTERERWSRVASRISPRQNRSTEKSSTRSSSRFRSMLRSRWAVFISAVIFALLSIGLAWYTEHLPHISIPWRATTEWQ